MDGRETWRHCKHIMQELVIVVFALVLFKIAAPFVTELGFSDNLEHIFVSIRKYFVFVLYSVIALPELARMTLLVRNELLPLIQRN